MELVDRPIDTIGLSAGLDDAASGALASFVGRVRDHCDGRPVARLEYSAHPTMALAQMNKIADDACERWPLIGLVLVHRTGALEIGDDAVLVAVASGHRDSAFAACRHCIEALKLDVPIWKHEQYADGEARWIGSDS